MGCGNCEGATGLGRRPELFVNGCVARGSNDVNAVWVDIAVARQSLGTKRGEDNSRGRWSGWSRGGRRRVFVVLGRKCGAKSGREDGEMKEAGWGRGYIEKEAAEGVWPVGRMRGPEA